MPMLGLDEVGRGAFAGPVVAGAVILNRPIYGLTDSKLLSPRQRERLAAEIAVVAAAVSTGWVSAGEINTLGLSAAVQLAMKRAISGITANYDEVVIDGNINYLKGLPGSRAVVKADLSVPSVSAASIVAKVARDRWMQTEAHQLYPDYGFNRHVGYGTALHRAKLKELGPCPLHRLSWRPLSGLERNV